MSNSDIQLYVMLAIILIVGIIVIVIILKNQKKQQERKTSDNSERKTMTQSDWARILEEKSSKSDKWRAAFELQDPYMIMRVLMSPDQDADSFLINDKLASKITDPAKAKRILLESPGHFCEAYKHFAEIITDEKDLEEILLRMKTGDYKSFLEKITDEEILLNLARNAARIDIRFDAAEKLGNHDLMDELILKEPKKFGLEKVHAPEVLRRISENEQLPDIIKLDAAILLEDEALIRSFGEKMGWNYDCRSQLKKRKYQLPDTILMSMINDPDIDRNARKDAVDKIKDTSLLDEAAEHCEDDIVRIEAYKRSKKYSRIMTANRIDLADLRSDNTKIRQMTADKLISLAETTPEVLLPIWDYLKETIEEPVTETRANRYDLEEAGYYNEYGIGKKFPDKPSETNRNSQ